MDQERVPIRVDHRDPGMVTLEVQVGRRDDAMKFLKGRA
jgi:hypothetical protein